MLIATRRPLPPYERGADWARRASKAERCLEQQNRFLATLNQLSEVFLKMTLRKSAACTQKVGAMGHMHERKDNSSKPSPFKGTYENPLLTVVYYG